MKRLRLAVLVPRVKRIAKDNMPMELTSEGDLEPHDPASYGMLFQKRGNNGSDPQIREEIRMAAASSRARISWPCATKFERPNLILWRSHEIRWFDVITTPRRRSALDTGAPDGPNFAAVPRNSPVVVPENFGAPRSGPEIPECSSLRIYSRIPRSLLVIRPVIAAEPRRAAASKFRSGLSVRICTLME